jgi:hypothetical protein
MKLEPLSDVGSQKSEAVDLLVRALWSVREGRGGRIERTAVKTWGRMLAEAVQADARADGSFSPEVDRRVLWAREVLAAAVRGESRCWAVAELEATIEYLLGMVPERCGKDLAAGD